MVHVFWHSPDTHHSHSNHLFRLFFFFLVTLRGNKVTVLLDALSTVIRNYVVQKPMRYLHRNALTPYELAFWELQRIKLAVNRAAALSLGLMWCCLQTRSHTQTNAEADLLTGRTEDCVCIMCKTARGVHLARSPRLNMRYWLQNTGRSSCKYVNLALVLCCTKPETIRGGFLNHH